MTPIITIRPEPGASGTVQRGKSAGLQIQAFPLSEIAALEWQGPDPDEIDALLVGSAAAFRMGGTELEKYKGKRVFAVGDVTALAARNAGFEVEEAGAGGLQALLSTIQRRPLRFLRLAGERKVEITPPEGIEVTTRTLYHARNIAMSDDLAGMLRTDLPLVLLHSGGMAEHFRAECQRLGLDLAGIRIAALGPRIAQSAGTGWAELRSASQPGDAMLLAIAKEMCQ